MADKTTKVGIVDTGAVPVSPASEETLLAIAGLVIDAYDYMNLSYTGSNLTGVVYKSGGSSGTTVATLVLTYDGSDNLLTVTKT